MKPAKNSSLFNKIIYKDVYIYIGYYIFFCLLYHLLFYFFPLAQKEYPLNPKAMSLGELYGENDLSTNEWTDGVLSSLMRAACAGTATKSTLLYLQYDKGIKFLPQPLHHSYHYTPVKQIHLYISSYQAFIQAQTFFKNKIFESF